MRCEGYHALKTEATQMNHEYEVLGDNNRDNQSVESESFGEDQGQQHSNIHLLLLCVRSHSRVSHQPYCQSSALHFTLHFTKELSPLQSPAAKCAKPILGM
eukprot:TRINITY_DN96_c0_g1_i20.p1 TRINITY_DN96_c0_g1~~TRINITY_DN96_c0_g1_i20.p1  ORF type:complete len:115 (+),score=5.14 TRINITY_DN96_c0_g1_i20:45-347(+)